MGITSGVASFALETSTGQIPPEVVSISKEMMLNAVGIGLAGGATEDASTVVGYVHQLGGTPECTVLGHDFKAPAELAALANGALSHVLDFDETFERRGNHPSPALFATVMALGEERAMTGREVLEAFIIGCEVSTKIGAVGDLDELKSMIFKNGWHLSSVGGTIGSTAAAGRLLGLDLEQMENALGIAVSETAGLQVNYGHSAKCLHTGQAAMHGIMAAKLASSGFSGARNGLEADDGYLGCFRGDTNVDEHEFLTRLGRPFDVIDPGVGIKYYPCATTTHTSIGGVLDLVASESIRPEDIEAIDVSLPLLGGNTNSRNTFHHPSTGLEAKFSVPYCVAVAAVHGRPKVHHFTDGAVRDPDVRAMLDRISLHWNETPTIRNHMPSTVQITLTGGRVVSRRTEVGKGHASNPMTRAELDDKFIECADGRIGSEVIERALADFRRIEDVGDVKPLFSALSSIRG